MFTGLVQAVGQLQRASHGLEVRWQEGTSLGTGALALGASIAVDGVCLTVAEVLPGGHGFRADVSGETLARSTLGAKVEARGWVNLEPALRLADRLGGHLVSGHVDGLGTVTAIEALPSSWRLQLRWQDPAYGRYVCPKASVAVDGISLTVAGCRGDGVEFWIAVIPHTWAATTLRRLRPGAAVNLEADLLAKYTERLLRAPLAQEPRAEAPLGSAEADLVGPAPGLSEGWLRDQGWS